MDGDNSVDTVERAAWVTIPETEKEESKNRSLRVGLKTGERLIVVTRLRGGRSLEYSSLR
jgi:hypothetical protein